MAAQTRARQASTPRPDLILYVESTEDPATISLRTMLEAWAADQKLGEVTVVEGDIGEPRPCLFTNLGVLRGQKQIEYFVAVDRNTRALARAG